MLKVINLSVGRTGTMSLKHALEELGLIKCYHFAEFYEHPEHLSLWLSVSRGEKMDWDKIFYGYQASVYWVPCYNYQAILEYYPDAKVILTVRDPEAWYKSVYDTVYRYNRLTWYRKLILLVMGLFKPQLRTMHAVWQLQEQTLWKKTFQGRFHDKNYAIEVFKKHITEVKCNVPEERLLVFNIKEGWGPLCQFLNIPVPTTPFPHVNDTASFIEWRKGWLKDDDDKNITD